MAESKDVNYSKFLFDEVMEITSLAHYARVQANEAELRARYCMALAEKAVCEAESVHQVSESLTCTSKMVANMTLEYINSLFHSKEPQNVHSKDTHKEDQDILKTLKRMETSEKLSTKSDHGHDEKYFLPRHARVSPKSNDHLEQEKQFLVKKAKSSPSPKKSESEDSNLGSSDKNVRTEHSNENLVKFQEQYPESDTKEQIAKDLPKEFDSSHSLPTLYEDSYKGAMIGKPVSWTEKKEIRKVQRKLRDIDLDESEPDTESTDMEEYHETEEIVIRTDEENTTTYKN